MKPIDLARDQAWSDLRRRAAKLALRRPRPSSVKAPALGSGTEPEEPELLLVRNSNEPYPVWYLKPIGSTLTDEPQVPPSNNENVSDAPP